jgi:uncharacterized protein YggU (UPF0235/DUF167 family)
LAVPRRAIHIVHGATSREKLVEIEDPDLAACQRRLDAAVGRAVGRVDKHLAGG